MASSEKIVRIGGASGFWGDSMDGARQLVASRDIDYLVFDYLAETTMAILAAARLKKPEMGYATDFVEIAMRNVLTQALQDGVKIVANAGGMNPRGCAHALNALAASLGLAPKIAVVEGDDVASLLPRLREAGVQDMFSGAAMPANCLSANAYLGAFPIAQALKAGADIVITGRGVDSAVTLGPLIHEFGWTPGEFDKLAGGSLAGHIIECGCQATGGLHTDWEDVPDWPGIGYPIVRCTTEGHFSVTKPKGTGGLIRAAAVAEQMLYEIGDPGAYALPDVVCDFRRVTMTQVDEETVHVTGAHGRAPSDRYKVSATALNGYRCAGTMVIVGIDAAAKALRTGEAVVARVRRLFREAGIADFTAVKVELLGAETLYGPNARTAKTREAMVRIVADHRDKKALELFAREISPSGTSWSPGTTGPGAGRPSSSPQISQFSFLLPKAQVPVTIRFGEEKIEVPRAALFGPPPTPDRVSDPNLWVDPPGETLVPIRLVKLAWARSGDKGDISNIGLIARKPEWLPLIWARVTPDVVRGYFAHLMSGEVERFPLPGIHAVNYLLHSALAGGGPASTRWDPLGKGMAQMLLDLEIEVPTSVVQRL